MSSAVIIITAAGLDRLVGETMEAQDTDHPLHVVGGNYLVQCTLRNALEPFQPATRADHADVFARWLVLRHGLQVDIRLGPALRPKVTITRRRDEAIRAFVTAAPWPRAVCLAGLKALGVQVEGG